LDELPPQTRRLLLMVDEMVKSKCEQLQLARTDYRFTQRDVREHSGIGNTQCKLHLQRLIELEYVLVHRGGRGQQFIYELIYDGAGRDGQPFLPGLIDVEKLRNSEYDKQWSGQKIQRSGSGRDEVGAVSVESRSEKKGVSTSINQSFVTIDGEIMKNAYIKGNAKATRHSDS
jgi:hypothetical protein